MISAVVAPEIIDVVVAIVTELPDTARLSLPLPLSRPIASAPARSNATARPVTATLAPSCRIEIASSSLVPTMLTVSLAPLPVTSIRSSPAVSTLPTCVRRLEKSTLIVPESEKASTSLPASPSTVSAPSPVVQVIVSEPSPAKMASFSVPPVRLSLPASP